jgi:hypothetical protein
MVDVIVGEIDPLVHGADWKSAVRQRILSARRRLLRHHPWAARVIESRTTPAPLVLKYMDSLIGMFRTGGFSVDLTHVASSAMVNKWRSFPRPSRWTRPARWRRK